MYQNDFKKWTGHSPNGDIIQVDNLNADNRGIPLAKYTEYNFANYTHEMNRKRGVSPSNSQRQLYEMFKEKDKIPHGVIPKLGGKKNVKTEYNSKYNKWKVRRVGCDLNYMPKADKGLVKQQEHMFWDKYNKGWHGGRGSF